MNNEIGRKITSLTLMTIMLAGGMTFAAPGMVPEAHAANANLFVSAENSQFNDYMSGPQVIEVIVINSDINDTNESKGEPTVTINGNELRMVQAVDGNWYGYFADRDQAILADSIATPGSGDVVNSGLDFGTFCSLSSNLGAGTSDVSVSETVGIAISSSDGEEGYQVADDNVIATICTTVATAGEDNQNVLREEKDINSFAPGDGVGQIGINPDFWPFIQLYELSVGGNVNIEYNPGSGLQSTSLTFDTTEAFAGVELDREKYPRNAQVHVTITDLWLNIDPTDEDSWTFGTNVTHSTRGIHYQVFDENGEHVGHPINLYSNLDSLLCETNCDLLIDVNAQNRLDDRGNPLNVLTLQDNGDTDLRPTESNNAAVFNVLGFDDTDDNVVNPQDAVLVRNSVPVTITEQGPKTGIFGTYDESDVSVLKITDNAARNTSATLDYNQDGYTIQAGFNSATIDIQPTDDVWNSGEEIPIVIIDGDANNNSRADEDLDLFNPDVSLIPTFQTGTPFTLGSGVGDDRLLNVTTTLNVGNIPANDNVGDITPVLTLATGNALIPRTSVVELFSERAIVQGFNISDPNSALQYDGIAIDLNQTLEDLQGTINDNRDGGTFTGFNLFNYDVRSFGPDAGTVNIYLLNATDGIFGTPNAQGSPPLNDDVRGIKLVDDGNAQGYVSIDGAVSDRLFDTLTPADQKIGLLFQFEDNVLFRDDRYPIVADFFSFGFENDGRVGSERIANQIIRIEAEETGDNTSTFAGTLEYTMINQLNINDINTYLGLSTIADDPTFVVIEDLTDEDDIRVTYLDLGEDGVPTQISDQEAAPSHSGVATFDSDTYKNADTVIITVDDLDLNVDSDLKDIYTVVTNVGDLNRDVVGSASTDNEGTSITLSNGDQLGILLEVTFDDQRWTQNNVGTNAATECTLAAGVDQGLGATGFTLAETTKDSGRFAGSFQIPAQWCRAGEDTSETATGLDIEINYFDFRDASGEINEVGDSAGVSANTGSVSLDRTVYPVPFGIPNDFRDSTATTPTDGNTNERSVFPIHQTGIDNDNNDLAGLDIGEFLNAGDLSIHVRVNDPDFDISGSGEDSIAADAAGTNNGPVKISVLRGSDAVVLGYAGGPDTGSGVIDVGNDGLVDDTQELTTVRSFGPIAEISPSAGIFEADVIVKYTDGPASTLCPDTRTFEPTDGTSRFNADGTQVIDNELNRFDTPAPSGENYCILQGDILQVEYTDPADASGDINTVTDSATFDLRNGVLQSDKSVYIIGSDMILTLIEPDLDLDNDQAETYDLDLIEWDSDAGEVTMGDAGNQAGAFDPEPLNIRETGDSTGIFQLVVEIPEILGNDALERGEEIVLEYTDWGPSGSDYVGDEDEDVNLTIYTSNFGATVSLDQKVYSWTDKVYITIVAPDHNFDSDLVDEIGNTSRDPIKVATRGFDIDEYKLVETGTDTGIFTGEVILTGFLHDADGDGTDDTNPRTEGTGPTDGFLQVEDDDSGLSVSFEFSEDETVVGSSLIRWNVGVIQWLEASYPASGTGIVRVIDPDLNLDPEAVDNFDADVWSDSDGGGIDLTVTETNEATGIYEGTVYFTVTDESSGHRLRVSEGDTVTARYQDNTLPSPYTDADELNITATTLIGTIVPPLERAPVSNLRTVDSFGGSIDTVSIDQQVQISADLVNGQDKQQLFAYLIQVQDGNGVTVSLAWILGELEPGQALSPAVSWIPTDAGTYTATAFVWESIENPTALSPPLEITVSVN